MFFCSSDLGTSLREMDISFVDRNGENKSVNTTAGTFKPLSSDGQHPLNCGSPFKRFRRTVVNMTRKDFLKTAGACALGAVGTAAGASAPAAGTETGRAKVYFSPVIDSDHLNKLYDLIKDNLSGKIAIKLHTGERHGPNILPREMVKSLQARIPESTIVETNTLYHGDRYTTEDHLKTLEINGWTFCPVDIMDAEGTVNLPVKGGKHFKEVSMGGHIVNYDSMLVLTHFKGHAMGGFGGSMKNIAIGCADGRIGKQQVHAVSDVNLPWDQWPGKEMLMETMAESAKAVCDYFGKKIVFINVLRRMSVDCDCAGTSAAEPTIPDIGILASTDILAIDQASVDLVYGRPDAEKHDLVERIESRRGLHQLTAMKALGMGNDQYDLITVP